MTTSSDGFDASWRAMLRRQRDMLDVVAAVIRLTDAGAHPVGVAGVCTAVDLPAEQVRRLIERADAGLPSLRTGLRSDEVWLDFATTEAPRFWYQIGERRIGVAGCGPDIFEVAHALDAPMRVQAACPVTGTAISVDFGPGGMGSVRPVDTVVAAVHLGTVADAAELTDAARVDADVCTQQTFFANAELATPWLDRHPGGRVFPVTTFDQWWRDLRASTAHPAAARARTNADASPPSASHCY